MKWVLALALQLLLAAVVALVPRGAAAAQAQPHISLQPDMIPAGGQTTVSGAGFCGDAACSRVKILFDGAVAASGVLVGPNGTFTVGIKPISTPGRRIVEATQDTPSGRLSADALLTLTLVDQPTPTAPPAPTSTASPPAGTPSPPDATVTATASPPDATATATALASLTPSATPSPSGSPSSPAPSVSGSDGGGFPWWVWVALALAGVSAVFAAVFRLWRRRRTPKL